MAVHVDVIPKQRARNQPSDWENRRAVPYRSAPIRVELLGKLRLTCGQHLVASISTNRLQSLLAFLVLHGDVPQSREHLAFLLWPESTNRKPERICVSCFTPAPRASGRVLAPGNRQPHSTLAADTTCSIDVIEFEAARIEQRMPNGKAISRPPAKQLEQAARLYQDDLLPDLYDEWLQTQARAVAAAARGSTEPSGGAA